MRCKLRAASIDDAQALARIARDVLPEGWTEASLAATLARAEAMALVTEPLCGFVLGWRIADVAEILTLAVRDEARGQGLGRALVVELLEQLRSDGARSVSLEVRSSNVAALALYASLGFTRAGVRPAYYRDGEDALVLGAAL